MMEHTQHPEESTADPDTGTEDAPAPRHWYDNHSHRSGPLLLLALSLCFIIGASQLEFGSLARPGPALWPMSIGLITGALALTSALLPHRDEELFTGRGIARALALLAGMLAFPFLFDHLGFALPSALLILFMMKTLAKQPWLTSALVAVLTTGAAYLLFGMLLSIRLPLLSLPF